MQADQSQLHSPSYGFIVNCKPRKRRTILAKVTCAGWEKLPHEADESEVNTVGSTKLCNDCYSLFKQDPMKEELAKYL